MSNILNTYLSSQSSLGTDELTFLNNDPVPDDAATVDLEKLQKHLTDAKNKYYHARENYRRAQKALDNYNDYDFFDKAVNKIADFIKAGSKYAIGYKDKLYSLSKQGMKSLENDVLEDNELKFWAQNAAKKLKADYSGPIYFAAKLLHASKAASNAFREAFKDSSMTSHDVKLRAQESEKTACDKNIEAGNIDRQKRSITNFVKANEAHGPAKQIANGNNITSLDNMETANNTNDALVDANNLPDFNEELPNSEDKIASKKEINDQIQNQANIICKKIAGNDKVKNVIIDYLQKQYLANLDNPDFDLEQVLPDNKHKSLASNILDIANNKQLNDKRMNAIINMPLGSLEDPSKQNMIALAICDNKADKIKSYSLGELNARIDNIMNYGEFKDSSEIERKLVKKELFDEAAKYTISHKGNSIEGFDYITDKYVTNKDAQKNQAQCLSYVIDDSSKQEESQNKRHSVVALQKKNDKTDYALRNKYLRDNPSDNTGTADPSTYNLNLN